MDPPKDTLGKLNKVLALNDYPEWPSTCEWYGLIVQDKRERVDLRLLIVHPIHGTYAFHWDLAAGDFIFRSLRQNDVPIPEGYSKLGEELIQTFLNPKHLADLAKSLQLEPPETLRKLSQSGIAIWVRLADGTLKPKFPTSATTL
jgi:hypothetical protein